MTSSSTWRRGELKPDLPSAARGMSRACLNINSSPLLSILISPLFQRFQHRTKIFPLFRESVFQPRRVFAIASTLDHALSFKSFQPCRQRAGGDAGQRILKILKPSWSMQKSISQNKNGPSLSDHIQDSRNGTALFGGMTSPCAMPISGLVP